MDQLRQLGDALAEGLEPSEPALTPEPAGPTAAAPNTGEPDWHAVQQEAGAHVAAELRAGWETHQAHLADQRRALDADTPAWRDHITELRTYAKERFGFTDQDLAQVADARAVRLLYDNWKREHQPASAQPTTRPAQRRSTEDVQRTQRTQRALETLSKTGSIRAAERAIEGLL
jgi:hypothetical protein